MILINKIALEYRYYQLSALAKAIIEEMISYGRELSEATPADVNRIGPFVELKCVEGHTKAEVSEAVEELILSQIIEFNSPPVVQKVKTDQMIDIFSPGRN